MNKMKTSCSMLLNLLASRDKPWSIKELQSHSALHSLHVDLTLLLQKLVQREYIREVAVLNEPNLTGAMELHYMIAN